MQKIVIAGATGYLGRFVVQECKQRGYWVRALARSPEKLNERGPFLEPAVEDQIDEIFVGDVTKPETLEELCDGIDFVFSSVGLTRQSHNLSFHDVDYRGNKNILDSALKATVKKFIYISVYNAHIMEKVTIVKAHEDFVRELRASQIDATVIRPTGYFSDMTEYLKMAQGGRAYVFGDGKNHLNPIHGADLAEVCVDAFSQDQAEISVGGQPHIHKTRSQK